jgi:hypothetical protein
MGGFFVNIPGGVTQRNEHLVDLDHRDGISIEATIEMHHGIS